jgi:hypothetical protein
MGEVRLPFIGAKGRGGGRSVELDGRWQWVLMTSVTEAESDGVTI